MCPDCRTDCLPATYRGDPEQGAITGRASCPTPGCGFTSVWLEGKVSYTPPVKAVPPKKTGETPEQSRENLPVPSAGTIDWEAIRLATKAKKRANKK